MKICNKCNKNLEDSEFYVSGKYKNKISRLNTCKKCTNQKRKEYTKAYRIKILKGEKEKEIIQKIVIYESKSPKLL